MTRAKPRVVRVDGSDEDVRRVQQALGPGYLVQRVERKNDARKEAEAPGAEGESTAESLDRVDTEHARTLLRCLGEGICLGSPEGRILWANDFFRAFSPSCRAQIESVAREAAEHLASCLTQNKDVSPASLSCKFEVHCSESDRRLDIYVTPVVGGKDGRELASIAVIARDVTEAYLARRKMDAIDRAGYELVRMDTEELRKLNSYQRLQVLEEKIVRYTREILNFDHFAIFLIDEKRRKLELIVSEGLPEGIQDLDLFIESEGSGISGMVAQTGMSYICRDAGADERFLPGLAGAHSSLTVPIRLQDRVIGVMDIESRRPNAFSDEDRQFVEIFARHIAMALHMLDLLVAERTTTNQDVSGRFAGELNDPLEDIASEVGWLRQAAHDPETARHIAQIMDDVESIRSRMRNVASGPQTILGVDRAMLHRDKDPVLVGKRILVADDAPKIRKIIGDILSHRGASVEVHESGQGAIDSLKDHARNRDEPFDLIISDIQMPDRNGYEVFSSARTHAPEARVILMTGFGYDPHHSIVRASQEGLQSVLFKPFEIEAFLDQVRKALTSDATGEDEG
ncbi:MAG: response regulator [Phycisphaerales bacterium JB059]